MYLDCGRSGSRLSYTLPSKRAIGAMPGPWPYSAPLRRPFAGERVAQGEDPCELVMQKLYWSILEAGIPISAAVARRSHYAHGTGFRFLDKHVHERAFTSERVVGGSKRALRP